MQEFLITPGELTLSDLRFIARNRVQIKLAESCFAAVNASADAVQRVITEGRTVYGVNTGFGLLANTTIAEEDLELLQRSIVLSHAAGVGNLMAPEMVRLLMVLKINSLARGFSGIRLQVIQALMQLVNHEVYPAIPEKGSVGASGDLAPLAHMSIVLLGEGEVIVDGERLPAKDGLVLAGLKPISLAPKEGLALLNGTQASTAFALMGLFGAEDNFAAAMVSGAMCVEAAMGSRRPFDERIHLARGHEAQIATAAIYRRLLGASELGEAHIDCQKVQDPYSLRCQPQVMGACLQQLENAAKILHVEANGVSDNPLVFAEDDEFISGGNFHAEPVAMAADNIALAIAEIGALSERRMALLIDSNLSGLPPFLVDNGGVNSGFMIAQVTAAALASENKSLAHPSSVDSLPTSANQEDHVSMATYAGRRLRDMNTNTAGILAVELLSVAQGLDFRAPLKSSEQIEAGKALLRNVVPFYDKDRYFAPDIADAQTLIETGAYLTFLEGQLFSSLA